MPEMILTEKQGRVGVITFNRPDKLKNTTKNRGRNRAKNAKIVVGMVVKNQLMRI